MIDLASRFAGGRAAPAPGKTRYTSNPKADRAEQSRVLSPACPPWWEMQAPGCQSASLVTAIQLTKGTKTEHMLVVGLHDFAGALMRSVLVGLLLSSFAGVSLAGEVIEYTIKKRSELYDQCAEVAASVYEVDGAETGHEIEDVRADVAIPTCELALDANPDSVRVKAWLAHAYAARGQWGDIEAARPLLESAQVAGNMLAAALLADILSEELATAAELGRALVLARRAAEADFVPGQYVLGRMLRDGRGTPINYVEAGRWLELAAVGGMASAQLLLAGLYQEGTGRPKDPVQARHLYELAARHGNVEAIAQLGSMYEFAQGVPQSDARAAQYYERAAAVGEPFAQNNLGYLYQHGLGVERDLGKALRLYRAAALGGHALAWYNLGYVHSHGLGVPADHVKAVEFFQRAADAGIAEAHAELGNAYASGKGIGRDPKAARRHYEAAVALGLTDAVQGIAEIEAAERGTE